MDAIRAYKLKSGNVLKIYTDDDPMNPRKEWDNLGTMLCWHSRYDLGDKNKRENPYKPEDYGSMEELANAIIKGEDVAVILPLYLYDHSGITMSTGPFSCPWDSGQVGFIFVSKEKLRKEYSKKHLTKKFLKKIEEYLTTEVNVYDQYLTGDVYGFRVVKPTKCDECGHEDEDEIDACWGFFGDDIKENGIMEHVGKDEIVEEIKG